MKASHCSLVGALTLLTSGCAVTVARPHPPQSLQLPCNQTDCLRVLSWNLHGLPFMKNTPGRLQRVAAVVAEQQPDLVLFQEVWLGKYKRSLAGALEPNYEMVYAPRFVTRWPRGGLLMFVRKGSAWRATKTTFTPYEVAAPWCRVNEGDGISGKGILAVQMESDGSSLVVVDTHLQSPYRSHPYVAERRAQIEQLDAFLRQEFPNDAVLIGGDFNTTSKEPLYQQALSQLGSDLGEPERDECDCGTHFDDDGGRQEWIDYVFARNWPVDATVHRITNDFIDGPYSDHDGLLVRLIYKGASLRPQGAVR